MSQTRINEAQAREILARAAEIDRTQSQLTTVDALRAAAREAGIADSAFDEALAELQRVERTDSGVQRGAGAHRRSRFVVRLAIVLVALLIGFVVMRTVAPVSSPVEIESPAIPTPAPAPTPAASPR